MDKLDIQQIEILIGLLKWFLGGVLLLAGMVWRFAYRLHKDIQELKVQSQIHRADFENLKRDHQRLYDRVYHKN